MPKPSVLYVDDDQTLLTTWSMYFGRFYEVTVFDSGEAALKWLDEGNQVDVIVSDQKMPLMNGAEFLAKARAYLPEIPFIAYTGFEVQDMLRQCVNDAKVTAFITKAEEPADIRKVIDREIERHEKLKKENKSVREWIADKQKQILEFRRTFLCQDFARGPELWKALEGLCTDCGEFESIAEVEFYTPEKQAKFIEECIRYTSEYIDRDDRETVDKPTRYNLTCPILDVSDTNARNHGAYFATLIT